MDIKLPLDMAVTAEVKTSKQRVMWYFLSPLQ
ncbi:hypothetical protein ALQ89_06123 [Pseudomonas amygdali pv. tabaci]|uniref:Uncharacterized protein n=1 Tax=Pseudomonas amygdali pv. tabaci TaxID=322 RepID=A0AAX1W3N4_PSEAJ|nr:hypothetical protein ALQ89_06123 [Pseudomonas amygdali pv. tabaci]